jgi:hypothetical protein
MRATSTNPPDSQSRPIRLRLTELRRVRDEVRLDLHLGGASAAEQWVELERILAEAEQAVDRPTELASQKLEDAFHRLRSFQWWLRSCLRRD